MWSLIKWLIFLSIVAIIALAITGYKIRGKTIEEHFEPVLKSEVVKEGIRDIRSLVGEGLKAAGEAISEDVTDDERKQLDRLVKEELMRGKPIEMAPGQKALPPKSLPGPSVEGERQRRPRAEEMQAMPPSQGKDQTEVVR